MFSSISTVILSEKVSVVSEDALAVVKPPGHPTDALEVIALPLSCPVMPPLSSNVTTVVFLSYLASEAPPGPMVTAATVPGGQRIHLLNLVTNSSFR